MINETQNTSANEWRFDEGCEKSPSAVILAFFTGTSSLRNLKNTLQLRLCFENKNILSFSYTKGKNTAIGLNSDSFTTVF